METDTSKSDGKGQGPRKQPGPPLDVNWRALLWYLPLALLLLWLWQDMAAMMTVRTIAYSEFKERLAAGEVTQCAVKEGEIVGRIDPARKTNDATNAKTDRKSPTAKEAQPATGAKSRPQGKSGSEQEGAGKTPATPPKLDASKTAGKQGSRKAEKGNTPEPEQPFNFRTVRVEDPNLVEELEAAGVKFVGVRPGVLSQFLIAWVLPLGLVFLLWIFLSKRIGAARQAVMSFGRSKAKLVADKDTGVRFDDVAGCQEAKYELEEVVDFLKSPQHYVTLGARIPKGVLLVGPPGTGKTLMARAVAGEAGVPFFSISGSDFVEMFVGVGAARVRDLFQQAKHNSPCIVFIDELDAIGRTRGVHMAAANDEREQTLNQLLVELDGFEDNAGVIILAATNRPEVLDRALLRPGRFDRQVLVDAPDLDGREAILKVHARDKPLADEVDLHKIAQATPAFSGADLANALNEAALLAARRKAKTISQKDIEDAVEKVVAGPERKSRRLNEEERIRVAHHETGHALVAAYSEHADAIQKISIIPRGRAALGYTLQLPTEDQFLLTQSELLDRLKGLLGGRAAEEIVYGEISTGAENDLEKATALARQMVCMFGMSDKVGLVHCARRENLFLPTGDDTLHADCSEQTSQQIDAEVKRLLDQTYASAKSILTEHREQLEQIASTLLEKETIDAEGFQRLLGREKAAAATAPGD